MSKETIEPPILLRTMMLIVLIPLLPCIGIWLLIQPVTPLLMILTVALCGFIYLFGMIIVSIFMFLLG